MNVLSQYGCGTTRTVAKAAFTEGRDSEPSADEIHRILLDAIGDGRILQLDSSSDTCMSFCRYGRTLS